MLPPADYEESDLDESAEGYAAPVERVDRSRQYAGARRPTPKNRRNPKPPNTKIEAQEADAPQHTTEDVKDLPMLDRFALLEKERQGKLNQRRIEKFEQEKMSVAHNTSLNNGSMYLHNASVTRHQKNKPEEGRIKLEERARIMMEEKTMREEIERRKRAEALKQQELEACTFKPKLNKNRKNQGLSKNAHEFVESHEKENQVEHYVSRQEAVNPQKMQFAKSKSPERDQDKEDRVSEMMKWGQNRDRKVYEKIIAEEAALAEMRGTRKLPLRDIEKLGERMYAAQQAMERKRKAQADHEFVSTCTFKPAINQKSVELAQQKKRRPITEIPAHQMNQDSASKVVKARSKSPSLPSKPKTAKPVQKGGSVTKKSTKTVQTVAKMKGVSPVDETAIEGSEPQSPSVGGMVDEAVKVEGLESPVAEVKNEEVKGSIVRAPKVVNGKPVAQVKEMKNKVVPKKDLAKRIGKSAEKKAAKPNVQPAVVAAIKCESEENLDIEEIHDQRKQVVLEENLKKMKQALLNQSVENGRTKDVPDPIPKKSETKKPVQSQKAPELHFSKRTQPTDSAPVARMAVTSKPTESTRVEYTKLEFMSNTSPDRPRLESEEIEDEDQTNYLKTIEKMKRIESGQENSYHIFAPELGADRQETVPQPTSIKFKPVVAQINPKALQGPLMVHPKTNHRSRDSVKASDKHLKPSKQSVSGQQLEDEYTSNQLGSGLVPSEIFPSLKNSRLVEDKPQQLEEVSQPNEGENDAEEILAEHMKKIASLIYRDKLRKEQQKPVTSQIRTEEPRVQPPKVRIAEEAREEFVPGKPIPRYTKNESEAGSIRSQHSSIERSLRRSVQSKDSDSNPSPDFHRGVNYTTEQQNPAVGNRPFSEFDQEQQKSHYVSQQPENSEDSYVENERQANLSNSRSEPDAQEDGALSEDQEEGDFHYHEIEVVHHGSDPEEPSEEPSENTEKRELRHSSGPLPNHHRYSQPVDDDDVDEQNVDKPSREDSHQEFSPQTEHLYDEDELFEKPRKADKPNSPSQGPSREGELEDWERDDGAQSRQSGSSSRSYSLEYNPPPKAPTQQSIHSQVILESVQETISHNSRPLEMSNHSTTQQYGSDTVSRPKQTYTPAEVLARMKMLCAALESNTH